jgi:CRISPR system Cascade subunit CasC
MANKANEIAIEVYTSAGIKISKATSKSRQGADEAGYLLLLGRYQIERLAQEAIDLFRRGEDKEGKFTFDKALARKILKENNPFDLALFGRMVADTTDLNVDASVQVAHAISVHPIENEYDYFTAVDEVKAASSASEDAGAGMIGTVEFNSSTLYRFANINVVELYKNLLDESMTKAAVTAFMESFIRSMPTGKQNTFANRTLPDVVYVTLRSDQSISFVGAFEDPILESDSQGIMRRAAERLASYAVEIESAYGTHSDHSWVIGVGDRGDSLKKIAEPVSLDQLLVSVKDSIGTRLGCMK